jgi:dTDP-glucose 4,6-dehydratase
MVTQPPRYLVTGAAGFIGSALCRYLCTQQQAQVIGLDIMSYAASRAAVAMLPSDQFQLIEGDINDMALLTKLLATHQPDGVFHLAAETHVDRSIDGPMAFVTANLVGTASVLEATRHYWHQLPENKRAAFRLLHVSTDEVYGSLGAEGAFTEDLAYAPNSPYAASKAGADHLARAWHKTYGLPVVISNCSNNYGPYQFPEKLIPLCIAKALRGEPIPVYGQGLNVRDWLYVDDHAAALHLILTKGRVGEKYNVGGAAERRNIDVVRTLCALLDELRPAASQRPHDQLITFVTDRPGHDERYAMDFSKLQRELGWQPRISFETGLRNTVSWYLANTDWVEAIRARNYGGERLGQIKAQA